MRKPFAVVLLCLPALLLISLILLTRSGVINTRSQDYYRCELCRAGRIHSVWFRVPLPDKIEENSFSRFYRQHVDPQHKHDWVPTYSHIRYGLINGSEGEGEYDQLDSRSIFSVPQDCMITILKSLPDPRVREAVVLNWRESCRAQLHYVSRGLTRAYIQNPHRKDWPHLLRKYELYPSKREIANMK